MSDDCCAHCWRICAVNRRCAALFARQLLPKKKTVGCIASLIACAVRGIYDYKPRRPNQLARPVDSPARSTRPRNRKPSSSSTWTARSAPPTPISWPHWVIRLAKSRASITVETSERDRAGYREFWSGLNRGRYQAGEYKRIGRGGKEIWIQASYDPTLDLNARPFKVVKYANRHHR
jgi:hypothetical protein